VDHEGQRVSALDRIDKAAEIPSLIVWGENDRIVPVSQGHRVDELVPHTHLITFRRAGHFPHRDDPARFVRVIDEFLARQWARQAGGAERKRAALGA
jgi:pimeloyl-ACP methyl ester carboxylesterase